ncbi:uncharacterized protein LOC132698449 [Cylas formicarius]|uniref:uncharacterized protein LOC132698449 n=1 Tax=Cylas formicarius TaxID=197179 RepID=UPI002958CD04|nr:uncharacterized protein LOC132698449 [Cylas formicarius]
MMLYVLLGSMILAQICGADDKITKEELVQLYNDAIATLNATVDINLQNVQNDSDFVGNHVNVTLKGLDDRFDASIGPLREKLEDIMEVAENQGTNFDRCQIFVEEIEDLPSGVVPETTECIDDLWEKADLYFNQTLQNVVYNSYEFPDFRDVIDDCNNDTCIAYWQGAIENYNRTLLLEINSFTDDADRRAGDVYNQVIECVEAREQNINVKAGIYLDEYAVCAGVETLI